VNEVQAREEEKRSLLASYTEEDMKAAEILGIPVESPTFAMHREEIVTKVGGAHG